MIGLLYFLIFIITQIVKSVQMKRACFQNTSIDENYLMRVPSGHIKTNYSRMKRVIFFILLFVLTNSLNAQTMINGLMDSYRFKKMTDGVYTSSNLKEKFSPGKIITPEGTTYDGIPLRYNAYSDDLEFQKGEDIYNIDPKTIIRKAEFGGVVLGCMKYDFFGKIQNGLFEILTEGKATLLVKYTIKFLEKDKVQAFADPKPARFDTPKKEYYMKIDEAPAKLFTNKKSLLELFGNRKDEMESYISKNKLSVREDDSLKNIIAYFNSL